MVRTNWTVIKSTALVSGTHLLTWHDVSWLTSPQTTCDELQELRTGCGKTCTIDDFNEIREDFVTNDLADCDISEPVDLSAAAPLGTAGGMALLSLVVVTMMTQ